MTTWISYNSIYVEAWFNDNQLLIPVVRQLTIQFESSPVFFPCTSWPRSFEQNHQQLLDVWSPWPEGQSLSWSDVERKKCYYLIYIVLVKTALKFITKNYLHWNIHLCIANCVPVKQYTINFMRKDDEWKIYIDYYKKDWFHLL